MSRAATRQIRSCGPLTASASSTSGVTSSASTASASRPWVSSSSTKRLEPVAQLDRVDLRPEAGYHAARLELGQARLNGAPRHAQAPRDLEQPEARVGAQLGDQPCVELVYGTGQSDQNLARSADETGQIDQLPWAHLHGARRCCTVVMFEEAQLYSPVTSDGGEVTVHLSDDHPGANDPEYRAPPQRDRRPCARVEAGRAGA